MSPHDYLSGLVCDKETRKRCTIIDIRNEIDKVFGLGDLSNIIAMNWWGQLELPYINAEMRGQRIIDNEWCRY